MDQSNIDAIYNLLDSIKVTEDNQDIIEEVRENLEDGDYMEALAKLQLLTDKERQESQEEIEYDFDDEDENEEEDEEDWDDEEEDTDEEDDELINE